MSDETPYRTPHGGKPSTSQPSTSQTHASRRAQILFGSYRRGDANDPDLYVASIAAVLARYPADLMRDVTDPNTGIQTTEKFAAFMPNAGELKRYCDEVAARRDRMQRLGASGPVDFSRICLAPHDRLPGRLATVFVPTGHKRYSMFVEWAKTADAALWEYGKSSDNRDGIWVSYGAWDNGGGATRNLGQATAPLLHDCASFYHRNPERAARLFGATEAAE
jgi:hypothetical protein